uniref:FAD-binding FR-type domain-containing protein n=1 Tax=Leersia perrieri TaxID=77586 RepID=A0A0D9W8I1_9ORYZ
MAAWRRPVLVRDPLGIVTAIELAFFLMFLALLAWFYFAFISLDFSKIIVRPGRKIWQAKLFMAALRLGHVGSLCCAFLFFPVARGSPLLQLVGLTSEASIKYHVWLGHLVMLFFTAHGLGYIVLWASTDQIHEMVEWARTRVANVPGELALLSGIAMWVTSLPRVRRHMFELFFHTHQLYALFLVFYTLHVGITVFCSILPGVFLFMVDRYLRFLQSRARVRLVSARLLASKTVELNFCKSPCLTHSPLSTIFVNVPCVSRLQWHPFTVTSSSSLEPDMLSVVIKRAGTWTQKLHEMLTSLPDSQPGHLDVSVEGPYSYSQDTSGSFLDHYDSLVMISGGSGITPFISVIRELVHRSVTTTTPSLLLISVFKSSADLAMLDLIVPASGGFSGVFRLDLRLEAFVTGENMAPTGDVARKAPVKELWFKPSPPHAPIAPVLGHNSWLCLAAVVSSSFAVFLLLLGAVQRLYVYPVDGNSNRVYPRVPRTLLNMLFLCVGVAVAASAAVLWNRRRRNDEAAKQINNLTTPATSPDKVTDGYAGVEVESSPRHFLEQVTQVHFGGRPNLRRMLLQIGGSGTDVGVMASDPPGLLEDVATICSSPSASNLHFESISFSW